MSNDYWQVEFSCQATPPGINNGGVQPLIQIFASELIASWARDSSHRTAYSVVCSALFLAQLCAAFIRGSWRGCRSQHQRRTFDFWCWRPSNGGYTQSEAELIAMLLQAAKTIGLEVNFPPSPEPLRLNDLCLGTGHVSQPRSKYLSS